MIFLPAARRVSSAQVTHLRVLVLNNIMYRTILCNELDAHANDIQVLHILSQELILYRESRIRQPEEQS